MYPLLILVVLALVSCPAVALNLGSAGTADTQREAGAVAQLTTRGLRLEEAPNGSTADLRGSFVSHADVDLQLISISSPYASSVQLLDGSTDITTGEANLATLTSLTIPAHGRIPSATNKIRLTGLVTDLTPGTDVPLTLHFSNGTTRDVHATVMLTY